MNIIAIHIEITTILPQKNTNNNSNTNTLIKICNAQMKKNKFAHGANGWETIDKLSQSKRKSQKQKKIELIESMGDYSIESIRNKTMKNSQMNNNQPEQNNLNISINNFNHNNNSNDNNNDEPEHNDLNVIKNDFHHNKFNHNNLHKKKSKIDIKGKNKQLKKSNQIKNKNVNKIIDDTKIQSKHVAKNTPNKKGTKKQQRKKIKTKSRFVLATTSLSTKKNNINNLIKPKLLVRHVDASTLSSDEFTPPPPSSQDKTTD